MRVAGLADDALALRQAFRRPPAEQEERRSDSLDHRLFQDILQRNGDRWRQVGIILEEDYLQYDRFLHAQGRGSLFPADEPLPAISLRFPLFAKPVAEGSSMGIRDNSVCRDETELRERVDQLQRDYHQPVLIEEFLPGDEFTVGIVGNGKTAAVVGLMQVVPTASGGEFVYSLEVKRDYLNRVRYRMTDELLQSGYDPGALEAVRDLALRVHRVFGCRDVSRVDIRCDRHGLPNFIEVNPLPGLNPVHSDLVIIARGHGWSYDDLIGRIVAAAVERWSSQRAAS